MAEPRSLPESIASIRRRLLLLLLRTFGIVVLLNGLLILLAVTLLFGASASGNPFYRSPLSYLLEAYYLGHGSWEGVQAVVAEAQTEFLRPLGLDWSRTLLLDSQALVVLDHGLAGTALVGQAYARLPGDLSVPLLVNGQPVGTLIIHRETLPHPWSFILSLMLPVIFASIPLGIFTLILGLVLMRWMINPLAEVMAAAQSLAGGDFSTRVFTRSRHDELNALGEHFNYMASTLERSDRERRNLLADVAHELRTPLSVLRGRLEGILDGIYPADEAHIAPALEEAYLLERLVDDLRLLTQVENRQLRFELRPLDLGELTRRVVDLLDAQAAESHIQLSLEVAPDLPLVNADPQRIEQVIGNLVGNALRYVPDNGRVNIQVASAADGVAVTVMDDGPGIPEDELPLIFDRFWRSERSRARISGGAGLGLTIARQLILAQGGKIEAGKSPWGGLLVRFVLPPA